MALGLCVASGPALAQSASDILRQLVPRSAGEAVSGPGRGAKQASGVVPTYREPSRAEPVATAQPRPARPRAEQAVTPAAATQPWRDPAPVQAAAVSRRAVSVRTSDASRACEQDSKNRQEGDGRICMAVEFLTDQAILRSSSRETLTALGSALNDPALRNLRFQIEGHTDTVGSPEHNLELSARRAQTVADYLREQGVDPARLEIKGLGFTQPLVPTGPQVSEPRNRRVNIVRLGG